ncbi:hypothetical protein [Sporolactobacillus putidus]|uniref:Uncharacterized protein n=1 Tax=Sporolactobacillus putidus TaxID=492735 RepID=A0A917S5K8_9BACL|nr:hypothetical protein [Sporolactobacillus putidus]GGL59947.1 hypothetical protein GCM10007968_24890 [Sporolactobacillus putidus]
MDNLVFAIMYLKKLSYKRGGCIENFRVKKPGAHYFIRKGAYVVIFKARNL